MILGEKPPEMTPFCVLSLGWGVQSWTIAAMAALGELPRFDAALHADATWDRGPGHGRGGRRGQ